MKHISEQRILELALDRTLVPLENETLHLRDCAHCANHLESERQLTAALQELPMKAVPDHFQKTVEAEFVSAHFAKSLLKAPLITVSGLAVLFGSAMLWLILLHPVELTTTAALAVARAVTLIETIVLVVERVPFAFELLTATLTALVLMTVALFAALTRAAAFERRNNVT